jgi:MFS family permease
VLAAPEKRSSILLVAASTLIGTAIESYDFAVYAFAAALTFPMLFFPKSDPFLGLVASYGVFWVGFLGKPLGGIIFGHFGDRVGRKAMLVFSLLLMGVSTFLVGLLPTYGQVGILAPLLLVGLRLCQGVAVGGEWGGAVVLAAEHAQPRFRGLLASCPQVGVPVGVIAASIVFKAVSGPHPASWRIPFLLSIVLVAVGVAVRLSLAETPVFEGVKQRAAILSAPVLSVLRNSWRAVVLSGGALLALSGGFYLLTTQILSYGSGPQSVLKLDPRVFFTANLVASTAGLVATPLGAWLSDRVGRRTVYLPAVALILIFAFPMYALIDTKEPAFITLAVCLFTVPASAAYGALGAMFSELFGANVRYSGVSLGYQFAALLGGGLAPLVATVLLKVSGGGSWVLALYLTALAAVSLASIYKIKETRHVDLLSTASVSASAV